MPFSKRRVDELVANFGIDLLKVVKFAPLAVYILIFSVHSILVKTSGKKGSYDYDPCVIIIFSEGIKALLSLALFVREVGEDAFESIVFAFMRHDWRMAGPAVLLSVGNNLGFYNLLYYDPQMYMILMNASRILVTAFFWTAVFGERITPRTWMACGTLTVGCVLANVDCAWNSKFGTRPARALDWVGQLTILLQASISSLSSVYSELLLKHGGADVRPNLARQNFVLATLSLLVNCAYFGYGELKTAHTSKVSLLRLDVLLISLLLAMGGLCASVVLKKFSALTKAYATACEILLTGGLASVFLNSDLHLCFWLSLGFISSALVMYSKDGSDEQARARPACHGPSLDCTGPLHFVEDRWLRNFLYVALLILAVWSVFVPAQLMELAVAQQSVSSIPAMQMQLGSEFVAAASDDSTDTIRAPLPQYAPRRGYQSTRRGNDGGYRQSEWSEDDEEKEEAAGVVSSPLDRVRGDDLSSQESHRVVAGGVKNEEPTRLAAVQEPSNSTGVVDFASLLPSAVSTDESSSLDFRFGVPGGAMPSARQTVRDPGDAAIENSPRGMDDVDVPDDVSYATSDVSSKEASDVGVHAVTISNDTMTDGDAGAASPLGASSVVGDLQRSDDETGEVVDAVRENGGTDPYDDIRKDPDEGGEEGELWLGEDPWESLRRKGESLDLRLRQSEAVRREWKGDSWRGREGEVTREDKAVEESRKDDMRSDEEGTASGRAEVELSKGSDEGDGVGDRGGKGVREYGQVEESKVLQIARGESKAAQAGTVSDAIGVDDFQRVEERGASNAVKSEEAREMIEAARSLDDKSLDEVDRGGNEVGADTIVGSTDGSNVVAAAGVELNSAIKQSSAREDGDAPKQTGRDDVDVMPEREVRDIDRTRRENGYSQLSS